MAAALLCTSGILLGRLVGGLNEPARTVKSELLLFRMSARASQAASLPNDPRRQRGLAQQPAAAGGDHFSLVL
jgi:hypothetical protein